MPEKTTERVEETTRRYMREAEDVAQDAFRRGNDFITMTTKFYFDAFEMMMRNNMEIINKTQHAIDDMLPIYRRIYTDGTKNWEEYINNFNKIITPPTK